MNTVILFLVLSAYSSCLVVSLPANTDECGGQCGINAYCNDFEFKCQCNDGFLGRPKKQCVSRNDNQLIQKMYLGYLNSKPPSDKCPMGSEKDIVLFPQCTVRETFSSLYDCWQEYADGFPYGPNKGLCTEKVAGVVSCVVKTGLRCVGSYCHNAGFFAGLAYNQGNQKRTEHEWKSFIDQAKEFLEPWKDLTYDKLLKKITNGRGVERLDAMIQSHSCPDLGEVPDLFKRVNKFELPVTHEMEEKYCKPGITEKMQQIGKEMTYKWFTSKSKTEVNRAYETFKKESTEAFLDHCSNVTKVHQAFYDQYRRYPVGPYDHEKELAMSLSWKMYLVLTDFMVKYFYPESNIYDESIWNSANSFLEKNVVSGEIENFLAKSDENDNTDGE